MKIIIIILSLMIMISCSKEAVSFNKKDWDIKCLKEEQVITKKCVGAIEKFSDLLIPSAHAQYDVVMQNNATIDNAILIASMEPCKEKITTQTKCTQYSVTLKK